MTQLPPRYTHTDSLSPYPPLFHFKRHMQAARRFRRTDRSLFGRRRRKHRDRGQPARSGGRCLGPPARHAAAPDRRQSPDARVEADRKSTRELQSLVRISYAVFCLKKKKQNKTRKIT